MRATKKNFVWLSIIGILMGVLCTPFVSSASDRDIPESAVVQPAGEAYAMPTGGMSVENIGAEADVRDTPWGTPVQVSPDNGIQLYHYPRHTTLTWQPMIGAISYSLQRQYFTGTWNSYSPVTVSGFGNTSYTFNFVGDQIGRWRVRAYNGSTYSPWSTWWTFSYDTKPQMTTPVLRSPAVEEVFYHFPRTTTLSWKMVPDAAGYKVEIEWCSPDRTTCTPYAPVTITNPLQSYYEFNFVGAQPGKWRVTTLGAPDYRDSSPSGWRWFEYAR